MISNCSYTGFHVFFESKFDSCQSMAGTGDDVMQGQPVSCLLKKRCKTEFFVNNSKTTINEYGGAAVALWA